MQGLLLRRLRDRDPLHHRQVQLVQARRLRRHRGFRRQRLDCSGSRHEDPQRAVQLRPEVGPPVH